MITQIRRIEKAVGRACYELSDAAIKNKSGKRSRYVSKAITKGETFTDTNVKSVRPGYGLAPKYKPDITWRRARVDLEVGDRLSWEVID